MPNNNRGAVAETLKEVIEYVGIIIRYTASGFIGLFILIIADIPRSAEWNDFVKSFPLTALIIAVVIGLIIYSIHHIVFDALVNYLSIKVNNKKDSLYILKKARRMRRANNEIRQKDMDSTFSLLNFLYCSSYLLILIPLFCEILDIWKNGKIGWWQLTIFGIGLFLIAFIGDCLITKEEFLEFESDNELKSNSKSET